MSDVASLVVGPAEASLFRVQVGRYGDRWYTDPLPGDDIAPASAWQGPAVSTIKKGAAGQDWSYVAMKRIAAAEPDEIARLAGLDPAQRYDTLKSINTFGLSVAAGRGTIVHWWAEDLLHGRSPRVVDKLTMNVHKIPEASFAEAQRYLPALRAFFDAYQPRLIAAEYVVCQRDLNGVGYGATPDGLFGLEGEPWAFDWKTRSADGAHGAYPEEAAQIAAGLRASYMIVEGAAGAERRSIPPTAGGLVVSIQPTGCRIYPIDVDRAWEHWVAMHTFWVARQAERATIGSPWHVRTAPAEDPVSPPAAGNVFRLPGMPDRRERLRERYKRLHPAQQSAFLARGIGADDLDAIEAALDEMAAPLPMPVDPRRLDDPDVALLSLRLMTIAPESRAVLDAIAREALARAKPISYRYEPHVRNLHVSRALVGMCERGWDETTFRELIGCAVGDAQAEAPTISLADWLAEMSTEEAATLDGLVAALGD